MPGKVTQQSLQQRSAGISPAEQLKSPLAHMHLAEKRTWRGHCTCKGFTCGDVIYLRCTQQQRSVTRHSAIAQQQERAKSLDTDARMAPAEAFPAKASWAHKVAHTQSDSTDHDAVCVRTVLVQQRILWSLSRRGGIGCEHTVCGI